MNSADKKTEISELNEEATALRCLQRSSNYLVFDQLTSGIRLPL